MPICSRCNVGRQAQHGRYAPSQASRAAGTRHAQVPRAGPGQFPTGPGGTRQFCETGPSPTGPYAGPGQSLMAGGPRHFTRMQGIFSGRSHNSQRTGLPPHGCYLTTRFFSSPDSCFPFRVDLLCWVTHVKTRIGREENI